MDRAGFVQRQVAFPEEIRLPAPLVAEAERFWIGYAPENHASGAGIRKAGFTGMAEVSFDDVGRPAVKAIAPGGDAAVARLLGLPLADNVNPCWRCVRAGKHPGMACADDACCCDYQHLEVECTA